MADEHKLKLILETIKKGNGLEQAAREAAETENAIRDLSQILAKSNQDFEEAKAQSILLRSEYKKMQRDGTATKEMFEAQSKAIEEAATVELAAIRSTQKLVREIRELGDESGISGERLDYLADKLQESEKWVTGIGGAAKRASDDTRALTKEVGQLGDKTDETNQSLGRLDDKTAQANRSLNRLGDGVDDAGHSLDKIEKKVGTTAYAMGNILADGIQDAAQAAFDFTKESYDSFRQFDDETRRIFAQVPDLSADMRDSLAGDAKVIASQIGRLPQETLPTLRKALNLGISEDNLLSSIETASMAARVGGESLIDTMVLGQSVVKAYGGELYSLSDVYDQLNYITQNSNLEFGDLNGNMTEIISAAAEAGVGLDSVAGSMITMNRQGDDAAEIAGLLSNVLTQISIEGTALGAAFKEAAGVGFREFTAAGGTLAEGLQILEDHAEATGQDLLNMVGGASPFYRDVQAARGVLELTGKHAAALAANTADAAAATGSLAQSAAEFENSPALTYDRAAASVENLKIATGQWIAQLAEGINLIENTNTVAQLLSGTFGHQIASQSKDIREQARATGEYTEALNKLMDTSLSIGALDFGLADSIVEDTDVLVRDLARSSTSYEEFVAKLQDTNAMFFKKQRQDHAMLGDLTINLADFYHGEQTQATIEYYQALAEADYWQSQTVSSGNAMAMFYAEAAQTMATTAYSAGSAAEAAEKLALANELAEQRTAVLLARQQEQIEYQQWVTSTTADYFNTIANGEGAQRNLNDIIYEAGVQYGATAEQQAAMLWAMGEIDKETLNHQLALAATQSAAAELGRQYAEGVITTAELREQLLLLQQGSPWEAEANVDTGDTRERLGAIIAQLNNMDGRKTRSTHTHTTYNETKDSGNSAASAAGDYVGGGGKSDSKDNPTSTSNPDDHIPQYSGGMMWPGNAYLVGDTASGKPTPYSEVIIPQQPMRNLGVMGSRAMLNGQQGGSITISNYFYGPVTEDAAEEIAENQRQSVLDAAQQIGWSMS